MNEKNKTRLTKVVKRIMKDGVKTKDDREYLHKVTNDAEMAVKMLTVGVSVEAVSQINDAGDLDFELARKLAKGILNSCLDAVDALQMKTIKMETSKSSWE